ncbi:hypothetical protein FNV43_RR04280 [Rhamnella rubrinervis]|uniref:RRM domain-containing protein n=1 Tax=Rhamnella rubrinervis TaxID=2594499 RepID=A0A8K0HLJ9_9ROSA|nr:hypothetical protein FNV43_RR04280 [Rhamnella rubrinervis]
MRGSNRGVRIWRTFPLARALWARHGCTKLFVGGLSYDTNETVLKDAFGQHGEIIEVKVICDHKSGKSKGYGFVQFTSESAAKTALKEMDGQVLMEIPWINAYYLRVADYDLGKEAAIGRLVDSPVGRRVDWLVDGPVGQLVDGPVDCPVGQLVDEPAVRPVGCSVGQLVGLWVSLWMGLLFGLWIGLWVGLWVLRQSLGLQDVSCKGCKATFGKAVSSVKLNVLASGKTFSSVKLKVKTILRRDNCLAAIENRPVKITDDGKWYEIDGNAIANLHLALADGVLSSVAEKKMTKKI